MKYFVLITITHRSTSVMVLIGSSFFFFFLKPLISRSKGDGSVSAGFFSYCLKCYDILFFFFCSLPVDGVYIYLEDIFVRGRCFSECLTVFGSQGKFVHLNNTQQKKKIHHGAHSHFMRLQNADSP